MTLEAYRWDNFTAIPEPSYVAMLVLVLGLVALRRSRGRSA
jgi:hypothetical protein